MNTSETVTTPEKDIQTTKKTEQKPKARCSLCRKKLGHIVFHCPCHGTFCIAHQSMHAHKCPNLVAKKEVIRDNIQKMNPECKPKTLEVM
tara:strand:- start:72 stop:341 length:270 start_codon:yes stop_codon:yes gene_type:complete